MLTFRRDSISLFHVRLLNGKSPSALIGNGFGKLLSPSKCVIKNVLSPHDCVMEKVPFLCSCQAAEYSKLPPHRSLYHDHMSGFCQNKLLTSHIPG